MGINLCIANSIEEINNALELENISLEDDIIDFIWRNKEVLSEHIEAFYKLEPYDDMLLTNQEVLDLKCFAQTLLNPENIERLNFCKDEVYEEYYVPKEEYLQFATDIKRVCEKSIILGKPLYSIGD